MSEKISKDAIDTIPAGNGDVMKPVQADKDKKKLLTEFLNRPVAERVKLKGRVVVNRPVLSTDDIARIGYEGEAGFPEKSNTCELVAGEQVLASGKIIKKKSGYFFKVVDLINN